MVLLRHLCCEEQNENEHVVVVEETSAGTVVACHQLHNFGLTLIPKGLIRK